MKKILLSAFLFTIFNTISFADSALNVKVYNSKGYPAKRINVKGYYGASFGSYPTQTVKTDNNGECVLTWDNNSNRLIEINIAGKKHKGKFYSGKTYVFEDR